MTNLWHLFTTNEFMALDVRYGLEEEMDEYFASLQADRPTQNLKRHSFETDTDLLNFVKGKWIAIYGDANTRFAETKIAEIKNSEINHMATMADHYYLMLEAGIMPGKTELREYFNKLVDHLEKSGGRVIEGSVP